MLPPPSDDLDPTHQLEDDPEMAAFAERIRTLVLQGEAALRSPSGLAAPARNASPRHRHARPPAPSTADKSPWR